MKVFAIIAVGFAALAAAAPAPVDTQKCKPGTYACATDKNGWKVCDVSGKWVYAGDCPKDAVCMFYKPSGSPYCVPPKFTFP